MGERLSWREGRRASLSSSMGAANVSLSKYDESLPRSTHIGRARLSPSLLSIYIPLPSFLSPPAAQHTRLSYGVEDRGPYARI